MAATTPIPVSKDLEREFPGADRRATAVILNLIRAESLVSGTLAKRLRRHGLSLATFNILMILRGEGGPLAPCVISERLLVTRGTVTGLLDSLETAGLIRRTAHPEDRRMLLVDLTSQGAHLLKRILPAHFAGEKADMACLSAAEKDALVKLLGKVQAAMQQPGI